MNDFFIIIIFYFFIPLAPSPFLSPLQIGDAYERIKLLGGDASNALLGGATEADSNISAPFQLQKLTYFESQSLSPDIAYAVFPMIDELASLLYGVYMRKKMAMATPTSKWGWAVIVWINSNNFDSLQCELTRRIEVYVLDTGIDIRFLFGAEWLRSEF